MPTLYIADAERDADMKNLSRKEAAKVLEDMKVKIEIPKAAVTQWERNTALDMAIETLKYSEVPNSSDCISRQVAIDELPYLLDYDGLKGENGFVSKRLVRKMLKELPSAQPENIRCYECKHGTHSGCGDVYICNVSPELVSEHKADFYCGYAKRKTDGEVD